jgi:hypothetical protein
MLKSQDLLISVTILALHREGSPVSYSGLGQRAGLSSSEAHAAVQRARQAGFLSTPVGKTKGMGHVVRANLGEFLSHGAAYVWPLERGGITRGVATAHSVATVQSRLHLIAPASPLVWPHPEGTLRGESITPLHRAIPQVAFALPLVHEIFALTDLIRLRDNRLVSLAATGLTTLLREMT